MANSTDNEPYLFPVLNESGKSVTMASKLSSDGGEGEGLGSDKVLTDTQKQTEVALEGATAEFSDTIPKQIYPGGSEQILLVDDEKYIIKIEKMMLERLGYKVTSFTNGTDALEAICNDPEKFDVVITDLVMPNMAGDKLASKILKIRPNIPIIVHSGFTDKLPPETAKKIGIKKILMKPIKMSELAQTIRNVLDI